MNQKYTMLDGNEAAANIAYKLSEVIAIYPITPSSSMGEWSDTWNAQNVKNIWGTVPQVTEMQSEAGAAGAVHGALQAGALTTTFTSSQGLLLMIPNMYKIAGELTPTVIHVAARSLATSGLSIFGDHSDVMAIRQTGFAMLCSNSVQEVADMALISHASTLECKVPFVHFFDGFRTSHEVSKSLSISDEVIKSMISKDAIFKFRSHGLTPDHPVIRGTAQNPDVFFQTRESVSPFYIDTVKVVEEKMNLFHKLTGRKYELFQYVGHPEAERVIIMMGSGAEAVEETIDYLLAKGEKVGILKVRLFRPFSAAHFIKAIPKSVKTLVVLDRTKEPGSVGEPLYQDILTAFNEHEDYKMPKVFSGRYGLSSKEFTPAMVMAIFQEASKTKPKNHFTIGINDDVSHSSLAFDKDFSVEKDNVFRGIFWGLGADGTVSANKNSIKIIGDMTENYAQGYFVYDSKKSGSVTTSHLRFGPEPIRATYLITKANFIACHQSQFIEKFDILEQAAEGATFLLNTTYGKDDVWDKLPMLMQEAILKKKIKLYVINAFKVARDTGMGGRINTVMQTCFFAISNIIEREKAISMIKDSIKKSFGSKGEAIVLKNYEAVDNTLANLYQVTIPGKMTSSIQLQPAVSSDAPKFVQEFTARLIEGKGDDVPVSMLPVDGTFPSGTTKYEKRNIADFIPVWDPNTCIQCGKCSLACPHAAIRIKAYEEIDLKDAPTTFKSTKARGKEFSETMKYTIQVAPEDCTGCELCVEVCPAKNKENSSLKAINMSAQIPLRTEEVKNWNFFSKIENFDRSLIKKNTIKATQLLEPLFEFSGACSGCGETPYIKLATQLFGDRMLIANATGCTSIYGGNLPTTPYTTNKAGRGPAWANSLFEDNAEFGLGFRLAVDKKNEQASEILLRLKSVVGEALTDAILTATQVDEEDINVQRDRIEAAKVILKKEKSEDAEQLLSLIDYLVKKSVWIFGGDGWAYDIGYGGLDHVIASGKNVNILVLDTEVYSNTGGQSSKATPTCAVAKFASNGKASMKKDLALLAMSYGNVYVGKVAMGANDAQTLKTFIEAEQFDGPSLIIAYSHCIAHGYNMRDGFNQQKKAVESGHWHLFRHNPELGAQGGNPFQLDSKAPKIRLKDYMEGETRFKMLSKIDPKRAKNLGEKAQLGADNKFKYYDLLAQMNYGTNATTDEKKSEE
jgi:pyruvate-ferredoxin/flavodoxin oxidoreductase